MYCTRTRETKKAWDLFSLVFLFETRIGCDKRETNTKYKYTLLSLHFTSYVRYITRAKKKEANKETSLIIKTIN